MNNLQTERLDFCYYDQRFYEELYSLFCENHIVMSTALSGSIISKKDLDVIIEENFNHGNTPFGFVTVHDKHSGDFIGVSGIFKCNYLNQEDIEFGFILDDQYWGKGYATEIGKFWINYVFSELDKNRIVATTSPTNTISQNVLEKLGLTVHSSLNIDKRGKRLVYIKTL